MSRRDDSVNNIQTASNVGFHLKPCRVYLSPLNLNNHLKENVEFHQKSCKVYLSPINFDNHYNIFRNCEVSLTRLASRIMLTPENYVTRTGRIATRFIHPNAKGKKSTENSEQLKKKSSNNVETNGSCESRARSRDSLGIKQTSVNEDKVSANLRANNDVNGNFKTRGRSRSTCKTSEDGGLKNKVNVGSNVKETSVAKNQKNVGNRTGNKNNSKKLNGNEETSKKGNLKKSVGNKGTLKKSDQRETACVEGEEVACSELEEIACAEVEEIACVESEDEVENALKKETRVKEIKDKLTTEDGKLRGSVREITRKVVGNVKIKERVVGRRRNAKEVEERTKNNDGIEENAKCNEATEVNAEKNEEIKKIAENVKTNAKVLGRRRRNGKDVEEQVKNSEGIEENVSRRRRNEKDEERAKNNVGIEQNAKNKAAIKVNAENVGDSKKIVENVKTNPRVLQRKRNGKDVEERAKNNERTEENVSGRRRNEKDVEERVKNDEVIEESPKNNKAIKVNVKENEELKKIGRRTRKGKDVEECVKNNEGIEENAKNNEAIVVNAKNKEDLKKIVETVKANARVLGRRRNEEDVTEEENVSERRRNRKDVEEHVKNNKGIEESVSGRRRNRKDVEEHVKNNEGIKENVSGRRRNRKDVEEHVKNNEGIEENVSGRRRNEKDFEEQVKNSEGNAKNNEEIEVNVKKNGDLKKIGEKVKTNARALGRRRIVKDVEEHAKNNEGIEENAKNNEAIEVNAKNKEDLKNVAETVKTNPRVLGRRRNEEEATERLKNNERHMKKNENAKHNEVIENAKKITETSPLTRRQKPKVNYRISEVQSNVSPSIPIYKKEVAMIRDHKQNDIYEFDFHEEKRWLRQLDEDSCSEKGFDKAINEEMKHIKKMEQAQMKQRVRFRNDKRIPKKIPKKPVVRNRNPSPKKPQYLKTQTVAVQQVQDPAQKIKDLMMKVKERQRHNEEKRLTRSLEMSGNGLETGLNASNNQSEREVLEENGSKKQLEMDVFAENVSKKRLEMGVDSCRKKLEMDVVEEKGLKRFELEDDELVMGPVDDVDHYEEVEEEPAGRQSPGIEENFGFSPINILQEIQIAPKWKKTFSKPNANSTMIASPWRPNLISRSGPRYLTTKRSSNLPTYDQDLVINSTIVEGSFMGSPCKPKTLKQSSILDFVGDRSPRSRPQNCSLFDADLLSPIKKAPEMRNILGTKSVLNFNQDILTRRREFLSPKQNPSPNRNPLSPRNYTFSPKSRNIINTSSPRKTSLSPNRPSRSPKRPSRSPHSSTSNKENYDENFMTPARSEEDVFFGFDNSTNPDPQTRVGVPTRVSMREVKRVVEEEKRAVQLLEAEVHNLTEAEHSEVFMSPVSQMDEDEPIVGLFEDFVDKAPAKSTYERKARKRYPEYSISGEDSEEEVHKKPKKKKKCGFTKQEQIEANKWIEKFNSMCKEVEQHKLEIE